MKSIRLLALLSCAVIAAPAFAQTYSTDWSFVDLGTGQTVGGVVSGLHSGTNLDAGGLTISVTQSPYADLLGSYTIDWSSQFGAQYNNYSLVSGTVTFANFAYENGDGTRLYFGTDPANGTFYPELVSFASQENTFSYPTGTSFGAATVEGVPEPATWALMLGGFGIIGRTLRSRRNLGVLFG